MEWLLLLIIVTIPIGLVSVFIETWQSFYGRKRSFATALAITCIVVAMPVCVGAIYLETPRPSMFQKALQFAVTALMLCAGISGVIGLLWDRRIARRRSELETDNRQNNDLQEDRIGS